MAQEKFYRFIIEGLVEGTDEKDARRNVEEGDLYSDDFPGRWKITRIKPIKER